VRNELAKTYSWDGQYDSALAEYDAVIQDDRENLDAHLGRCQVLAWKHEYEDALREVGILTFLAPMNIEVYLLAGKINAWNNDFNHSLEMYEKALTLDRLNAEALIGKCHALEGLGKPVEAFSEIGDALRLLPNNALIQEAYEQMTPRPKNQVFVGFQNENFDVAYRTDHRAFTAQYYRTLRSDLTLYAEFAQYRRFDQDEHSIGLGAYYSPGSDQSLYGYVLLSPSAKVVARTDASIEYTHELGRLLSAFIDYRLLAFENETANIVSPGVVWTIPSSFELKPRMFISRTIRPRATSYAFSIQGTYTGWEGFTPYFFYAVGNEAYLLEIDQVELSYSWSLTFGCKFPIGKQIVVRANCQYLNRIGQFHANTVDVGVGYSW
jgi:YaiO family outer membrane protein